MLVKGSPDGANNKVNINVADALLPSIATLPVAYLTKSDIFIFFSEDR